MTVFDIDDTLFDASQRETNARRTGHTSPYTGDRKPSEYPKGKKAFVDFFNLSKQFRIDPIVTGALDHVRTLYATDTMHDGSSTHLLQHHNGALKRKASLYSMTETDNHFCS